MQLTVNGKPAEQYFPEKPPSRHHKPFILTETLTKMSASVVVAGSGKWARCYPRPCRALALLDRDAFRATLKTAGLLTRDHALASAA